MKSVLSHICLVMSIQGTHSNSFKTVKTAHVPVSMSLVHQQVRDASTCWLQGYSPTSVDWSCVGRSCPSGICLYKCWLIYWPSLAAMALASESFDCSTMHSLRHSQDWKTVHDRALEQRTQ